MSSLLVTHGHHFGVRYELLELNTIGRSSNCTIQLLDEKTSRVHTSIRKRDGRFWLQDEGSSNGTGLNGRLLLEPSALTPGDEIAVGNNLLLFDPDLEILRDSDGRGAVVLAGHTAETVIEGNGRPPRTAPPVRVEEVLAALSTTASRRGRARRTALLESMARALGADRAALLETSEGLKAVCTYPPGGRVTLDRQLIQRVLERGRPLTSGEGVSNLTIHGGRSLIESRLGSALVLALVIEERVRGAVYFDSGLAGQFAALPLETLQDVATLTFLPHLPLPPSAPEEGEESDDDNPLIAASPAMKQALSLARRYAESAATVLITGETGTGKERISNYIHSRSRRSQKQFVAVNCGALPEGLAESELFGHEKGAFTGADKRKRGLFEVADGGTLLLDEVGDLPPPIQVKLLRTLQERRFYRVGGTQPISCDVRVIAATHRDLAAMVKEGTFRRDLYYRLNVLHLEIPPLRERPEDVGPLVAAAVLRFNARAGTLIRGFAPGAMEALAHYAWPGNVRELENMVERLLVLAAEPVVSADEVAHQLRGVPEDLGGSQSEQLPLPEAVAELEGRLVEAAMRKARGNKSRAARILGVSRPTLDRKLVQYRIDIFKKD